MDNAPGSNSLCKNCKYRIRRVFIPLDPSDYIDIKDQNAISDEENIVIMNHCLLLDMSIDLETTIECSHFVKADKGNEVELFKHDI